MLFEKLKQNVILALVSERPSMKTIRYRVFVASPVIAVVMRLLARYCTRLMSSQTRRVIGTIT